MELRSFYDACLDEGVARIFLDVRTGFRIDPSLCLKPSVCAVQLIKFCFLVVSLGLEVEDLLTAFGCDKIGK